MLEANIDVFPVTVIYSYRDFSVCNVTPNSLKKMKLSFNEPLLP